MIFLFLELTANHHRMTTIQFLPVFHTKNAISLKKLCHTIHKIPDFTQKPKVPEIPNLWTKFPEVGRGSRDWG